MYDFLSEYGLFFAKTLTLAILIVGSILLLVVTAAQSKRKPGEGEFEIEHLNEKLSEMTKAVKEAVFDKEAFDQELKAEKKAEKARKKAEKAKKEDEEEDAEERKRIFVLDFDGDIRASDVESLRETISAVLTIARPEVDEVVLKLESGGGMVHSYGFASSQLKRITNKKIHLTVCVDAVAASGGYMMACTADKILAAPFSIIGSIGVVAQIPNFNRLLKKHDIDYEVLTAGEYKRTLTVFGENTEEGRQKFVQDLEETHTLFKDFIREQRPDLDLTKVANGDVWYGTQALELGLVDELKTSDEYLLECCDHADVYEVSYDVKPSLVDRLGDMVSVSLSKTADRFLTRARDRELER